MIVMKVNGSVVWRNRFRNTLNGLNICGNEYSDSVNIKIDKIIKDNNENLKIEWEGITEKSSCEASFGIDNLMIHIK